MIPVLLALMLAGTAAAGGELRDDRSYLIQVARETWRYFEECRDPVSGLVWDHCGETGAEGRGEYTSPTNIALDLTSTLAAMDLGIITRQQAQERIETIVGTLQKLDRYRGFFFNFYETATLKPTVRFLSFVDNGWLTLALLAVRQEFPGDMGERATAILNSQDYAFFYDRKAGLMYHGFHTDRRGIRYGHYAIFCSEPRAASLLAISRGDVPVEHWFRMERARPAEGKDYRKGEMRRYCGVDVQESYFVYRGVPVVPSWGGSMFEFLMPSLFIDESRYARTSLAENNRRAVDAQIAFAAERGMPAWGLSPCANPAGGYGEYGAAPIGVQGYAEGVVTPHASFLALEIRPAESLANIRKMEQLYAIRGHYGFRDSVDTSSGRVASVYLALDQGMILTAIGNYLTGGSIRRRVMRDPSMKKATRILAMERFF
ncbi:MAG: hypothetical protein KatS3mg024_0765 [Armatimonadota bacterium]|nr:MAG: hypothetical protein KatS3mg024_0765 [Armatimonadota bacterium]